MCLLEESQARADLVGNSPPIQLHLQLQRVRVVPVEDRHLAQWERTFVVKFKDPLGDELGLLIDIPQGNQGRLGSRISDRTEFFGMLVEVVGDAAIGQIEDLRARLERREPGDTFRAISEARRLMASAAAAYLLRGFVPLQAGAILDAFVTLHAWQTLLEHLFHRMRHCHRLIDLSQHRRVIDESLVGPRRVK